MLKHNYHTHTTRCNHATLTAEEQIQLAIENKLETIGISEHTHSDIKGHWRLTDEQEFLEYVEEIKLLREKYKDKIKVLIGLEADAISPDTGKLLIENIISNSKFKDLDYQILGHHAYGKDKHIFAYDPTNAEIDEYLDVLDKTLATKTILYLAHPDGFVRGMGKWDDKAESFAKRLIEIAIKHDVPLGINFNGIFEKLDKETFPNLNFFSIAAKMGAQAIYELDVHSRGVWSEELFKEAESLVKKTGIKLVGKLI